MGLKPVLPDLLVDKSDVETSKVMGCDPMVIERVEMNLSKEPFLPVPLENKQVKESSGTTFCLENNKVDVPEAISSRGDILELSISTKPTNDSLSLGCETPRESIFDPFAPGPEEAAFAPQKKKVTRVAEVPPRRKLNFDSDGPLDGQEETGKNVTESGLHGSFKTPDSKPLLTGIASTCPDAPLRPSLKALKLSPGICRKIDFDAGSSIDKESN